jgi:hypothetical protein
VLEFLKSFRPMQRMGTLHDIADAAEYLGRRPRNIRWRSRRLGVHLHQLDSHLAIHQGVASRLRRTRLGRGWPARTRVRVGKRAGNIDRGIRDHGLMYPIAIDNDFATWRALGNDAWPAKYLYDGQGRLVKRWVGEGRYDEIEAEIRCQLILERPGTQLPSTTPEASAFARTGQPSYAGITNETLGKRNAPAAPSDSDAP